jgi:conjugal transfer mating pair stabilization protein TraN
MASNRVSNNASWVRAALNVANDPNPSVGDVTGTTSAMCHTSPSHSAQTALYSCESGTQTMSTEETCPIFEAIERAPSTKTCQTDSYYEYLSTFANIDAFTHVHRCTFYAGQGGLNKSVGCGVMVDQISRGLCAPPMRIGLTSNYLQYCKTPYQNIGGITYLGQKTNSCATISADTACTKSSEVCTSWIDQASNACADKTLSYNCTSAGFINKGLNSLACQVFDHDPACHLSRTTCTQYARDVPDIMAALSLTAEHCLSSNLTYSCERKGETRSDCQVPNDCTLKEKNCIDPNEGPTSACQTYDYVYACQDSHDASKNADHAQCDVSWVKGTAIIVTQDDPDNDLPRALSAINTLKDASISYGANAKLSVFGGEGLKCGKSIGGLTNCCKDSGLFLDNNLTQCNGDEQKLAAQQKKKACHYVGTYCANKSLFGCLIKKMSYCCYGSVLARIVEEAGHNQLALSWGDAKSPQCGGFSVEQFQQIDLTEVDFTDFYADRLNALSQNDPNATVAAITASIMTMNQEQRPVK